MREAREHVLIAGVSVRAFAESAARAGYRVSAVDAFGDVDLRAVAEARPLSRAAGAPFSAVAAAKAAREIPAPFAAYTSNFENFPRAVSRLARGRVLLGNSPAVLERVRDPVALMRALRTRGFTTPATRATAPSPDGRRWLLKPRRSGGGHGTMPWRPGLAAPRGAYWQERIRGVPGSIVFVADGRRAVPLGVSRQLVGERAFGARGFRYCGSLLAAGSAALFERHDELHARAAALAGAVVEAFGLRGLNGVDFIARGGVPMPIEVNPRWSASMELVERATGAALFALHAGGCGGRLPERTPGGRSARGVLGKAIVFARRDGIVPAGGLTCSAEVALADLPHPGERILRGHPLCTVLAKAADDGRCIRALAAGAAAVYRAVEPRARGAA
ncbi:MAG TPA: ATP-grasp domain-containing protein [Gemmatimonadales bacterium]